jgi:hypothetical protein
MWIAAAAVALFLIFALVIFAYDLQARLAFEATLSASERRELRAFRLNGWWRDYERTRGHPSGHVHSS